MLFSLYPHEGSFFAEGEKKGCYPFFDGFRQPTPDCSEPNGDGRIPVSMSILSFQRKKKKIDNFFHLLDLRGNGGYNGDVKLFFYKEKFS